MADINIIKGHDIQISGQPDDVVNKSELLDSVAIKPYQFNGIKPKLVTLRYIR